MTSTGSITVPTPLALVPTGNFSGNEGNFSSFFIEVGSPPQLFGIIPAILGQEVWLPYTSYCSQWQPSDPNCAASRGVENATSLGFESGESTSWNQLGAYGLSTESNLYPNNSGFYGLDTVTVGQLNSSSGFGPQLSGQVVALDVTYNFWLGELGLGITPASFPNISGQYPSVMKSLRTANLTTSLSFGYTAGRAYTNPQQDGSLILGGYDSARMGPNTVMVPIPSVEPAVLQANVTSIGMTNGTSGQPTTLSNETLTMNIDSSTAQIWLPESMCDTIADLLNLQYDPNVFLYLVNDTAYDTLVASDLTFNFQIQSNFSTPINIRLPYSAFDLTLGVPYSLNNPRYFPIRRAADPSQYTLGRTFLQEAYITVDWERQNMTIAQASSDVSTTSITPILPLPDDQSSGSPNSTPTNQSTSTSNKSSTPVGAIAGGVVGGIAAVAIAFGVWLWWRRRRRSQLSDELRKSEAAAAATTAADQPSPPDHPTPLPGYYADEVTKSGPQSPDPESHPTNGFYPPEKSAQEAKSPTNADVHEMPHNEMPQHEMPGAGPAELASNQLHELPGIVNQRELMSTPIHEMVGSDVGSELGEGSHQGGAVMTPERVVSPPFSSNRFDSPSPDVFGTPSPERILSPMTDHGMHSMSSIQIASSPSVQVFSSAQQEVMPSSEIVSNSAEREILGGTGSEIVVSSSPQQVASPVPERLVSTTLKEGPAETLAESAESKAGTGGQQS